MPPYIASQNGAEHHMLDGSSGRKPVPSKSNLILSNCTLTPADAAD